MVETSVCSSKYNIGRVESFISKIKRPDVDRYLNYWNDLAPKTAEEYYSRWVFSFMSIHTTWERNVAGYQEVMALGNKYNWGQLHGAVVRSRTGLTKMRTHAIWDFQKRYWNDPKWFEPRADESMTQCRDRLVRATYGIGQTKTSFVLEMAFPEKCKVVCLDTHILQLYNYYKKGTPNPPVYAEMEKHWVDTCDKCNVPSPIARHIYWDGIQKQTDTRYWSYVLERN
jgi:hypothetical protein